MHLEAPARCRGRPGERNNERLSGNGVDADRCIEVKDTAQHCRGYHSTGVPAAAIFPSLMTMISSQKYECKVEVVEDTDHRDLF